MRLANKERVEDSHWKKRIQKIRFLYTGRIIKVDIKITKDEDNSSAGETDSD